MRVRDTAQATDSVAVVGMRGKFPGAGSVDALWENLKNGVETISTFSDAELISSGIDPAYLNVPGYVNRGCVLDGIDMFDAGFFGYSARDAETMDPQQRVFMELCWEGLEEAGYDPESYPGSIGVFVGSDQSTYLYQIYQSVDASAYGYGGMMSISNEKDYVATQVSYKLNLHGPSMAIQTSCSTSLVTVCMACQSLLFGSCDIALAGGVGISVPQRRGYWYQPGAIYSPDGHCRPFDAGGQGTVVGNGAAVVVLKRLSDALEDGDQIHAVIKGFGLNNDGSAKVGYTAPSVDGQARAIRMAQRMAGVEPETIGYIEAHGTATALGDPIEIAALTKAFRERTNKKQFCAVGALKSNVGHLSSAAGVAGLVKGILAVKHGQIPRTVHYGTPNPQIDFKNSPFFIAADLLEWPVQQGPRRAGVSSFGVGGTNAHVVLEEAPTPTVGGSAPEKQLLVLSARSAAALEKVTDNLVNHLEQHPELDPADVAFTCQAGRKAFPHRRAMIFDRSNRDELLSALKTRDPQRILSGSTEMRDRPVVFLFSGQGTQYVDMGLELYDTEPAFREHVDTCAAILKGEMNLDIRDLMYPTHDRELAADKLKQTSVTQPALFTIEYALARLWMEWGIKPNAMAGHSIGEYVAACLSGVMDLRDALSLVAMRGRLMESMPGGSMLAISLPESALQPLLGPKLSLAAVNAPSLCVLSGHTDAIEALERRFADEGVMCKRLHTSHAFHSSMMDPVLKQFAARVSRIQLKAPQIPYVSNVTGGWIKPELIMSPQYWSTHLRQTVRFADNLRELMVFPDLALLEVGPGQTLGFLARQQGSLAKYQLITSSLRSAQEEGSDAAHLRTTLAKLWMGGVSVNWLGVHARESRRRVPLPTYPFERQRFWIGPLETPATAPETTEPQRALSAAASASVASSAMAGSSLVPVQAPKNPAAEVSDWFFVPTWKPMTPARTATNAGDSSSWLIFSDATGVGEEVAERLRASGAVVNVVAPGESLIVEDSRLTLRPSEKSDYEALLRALKERQQTPDHILHLWTVDDAAEVLAPVAAFDEAQARGFYSVMYLAHALGKVAGSTQIHLGVVTDRLHSVVGSEELRSLAGTLTGACKVIPQEYPNIRCRMVDIDRSEQGLGEALIAELTREAFAPAIAYRGRRRWTQQYEATQLHATEETPSLLRDGGVYLITGGYGNIGLVFAEAISQQVKAKLVLAGRSSFPARQDWDQYISSHPHNPKADQMRKIRRVETLGSEVLLVQADVTDRAQLRAVSDQVKAQWGPVNGILHGAANLSKDVFGPIREIDAAKAQAHFLPKAHGLLLLEEVFACHNPEFYVLLSSLSAVLGGLNLAAYGASNAFLDAEAARRNQPGKPLWITCNWDAWDFGPGADAKQDAISAAKGREAFTRILASCLTHVVVSTTPLKKRLDQWVYMQSQTPSAPAQAASNGAGGSTPTGAVHKRPDLSTQFVAPRSETEKRVAAVWEHLLGVTPIGVYDKFFELGGHSLLAIQLLGNLRDVFDLDIPVQRIFEAPTIAQLSESIDREKQSAPAAASAAVGEDQKLQEILNLVEGLSEAELDALLSDAESMQSSEEV